jgi:hypothetical protein
MIVNLSSYHNIFAHGVIVASTACQNITGTECGTGLPQTAAGNNTIPSILQILFGIIGVLTVLMIVIAGLRFVTGQDNPQEVSKAKNTIVYALIGLLIAIAAEGIVSYILGEL